MRKIPREELRKNKAKVVESKVEVLTLVKKTSGNCGGGNFGFRTMEYDPCITIDIGKKVGDIRDDGIFVFKDEMGRNVFYKPEEYRRDFTRAEAPQRASNKTVMYLSFAVVGFFIYKFILKK